jgi:hypothetical protein
MKPKGKVFVLKEPNSGFIQRLRVTSMILPSYHNTLGQCRIRDLSRPKGSSLLTIDLSFLKSEYILEPKGELLK